MKETYLYHGIYLTEGKKFYDHDNSLVKLEEILKDKHLYSRRMQGVTEKEFINFSGLDYISFCDRKLRFAKPYQNTPFLKHYTVYDNYISSSLSLGFDRKGIDVISTELVEPIAISCMPEVTIEKYGLSSDLRYSDMADEVQVKDKVSLGNLKCLTLPVHLMINRYANIIYDCGDICKCVDEINCLMSDYNYSVPIYDLHSKEKLNSEEQVQKVMKKYRMR